MSEFRDPPIKIFDRKRRIIFPVPFCGHLNATTYDNQENWQKCYGDQDHPVCDGTPQSDAKVRNNPQDYPIGIYHICATGGGYEFNDGSGLHHICDHECGRYVGIWDEDAGKAFFLHHGITEVKT